TSISFPTCAHVCVGSSANGRPPSPTVPSPGCNIPSARRINVVLPAPFNPTTATISPGSRRNVRSNTPAALPSTRATPSNASTSLTAQHVQGCIEHGAESSLLRLPPVQQGHAQAGAHGTRGHPRLKVVHISLGQRLRENGDCLVAVAFDRAGQGGRVSDDAQDLSQELGALGIDLSPRLPDPLSKSPHRRLTSGTGCHPCGNAWIERILQQQGLLGREVPEQRHLTDLRTRGDLGGSRSVISTLGKQLQCGSLQRRVRPVPSLHTFNVSD